MDSVAKKKYEEEAKLKQFGTSSFTDDEELKIVKSIEIQEQILHNLQDGCERAKQNSKAAENTYKRTLDTMNSSVDTF